MRNMRFGFETKYAFYLDLTTNNFKANLVSGAVRFG